MSYLFRDIFANDYCNQLVVALSIIATLYRKKDSRNFAKHIPSMLTLQGGWEREVWVGRGGRYGRLLAVWCNLTAP